MDRDPTAYGALAGEAAWRRCDVRLDCRNTRRGPGAAARQNGSSVARDLRGDRNPASISPRPCVGIAALSRPPVRRSEGRSRVNQREIAQQAHVDIVRLQLRDLGRRGNMREELLAIDLRSVRQRTEKVVGEELSESSGI